MPRKPSTQKKGKYLYSTIKRGTVKVTSKKQHALLHVRHLPHTHVIKSRSGKIYRKRVYT